MLQGLIAGGIALAGLGFVAAAWFLARRARAFLASAARAQGTIVDMEERRDREPGGDWQTLYAPVVSFDAGGRTIRFTTSSWSTFKPRLHRTLAVLYDANDPGNARVHSVFNLWVVPALLATLGVVLGVALGLLLSNPGG